jgi:thiamine-monophosphate kinase
MDDEFEKIDWLKARFELGGLSPEAVIGIGDDAAVFDPGGRPTVLTIDVQVEHTHFRRELLSPADVGWRALVSAASDIVAMAASPLAALCALTLPSNYTDDEFRELIDGIAEAADATGARVIGGNLSRGDALTLSTTVVGVPISEPVSRAGATPGDLLYVTGTLGSAPLGFRILDAQANHVAGAAAFVSRWRRPPCREHLAEPLARIATACIDVSDGCVQDLGHLCRASGVGAQIDATTLPLDPGFETACGALGADPVEVALTGGEDYELLFTAPRSKEADSIGTPIGSIVSGSAIVVRGADGEPLSLRTGGFRHFS